MLLDRLIRNGVMAREGGLPRTLAVVVYNGGERWTAIGEESHLAEVPSELAERDLALLQPQFYRRIDTGRGTEHGWPENNLVAVTARMQHSATAHELLLRLLAETRRLPGLLGRRFDRRCTPGRRRCGLTRWGRKRPFRPSRNWSRRNKRWQRLYKRVGPNTTQTCVPKGGSWVVQTSATGFFAAKRH